MIRNRTLQPAAGISLAHLEQQTQGYHKAEVTLLIAEKTHSNDRFNLLTLIELVPPDQADSLPIGTSKYPRFIRKNEDGYTFFAIRITDLPVAEALALYAGAAKSLLIDHQGVQADVRMPGELTENPPAARPLLVERSERQLGRLLPQRHTAFRVWSQLNMDKSWLGKHGEKFRRKVSEMSIDLLGYDLSLVPEHIGNVYLFGCNPLLRSWDMHLIDHDKDLLIRFNERTACSINGCRLVLEEVRAGNNGFYFEQGLSSPDTRIALPYLPDGLQVRLFDPQGQWIDHHFTHWCNFSFQIAVHQTPVSYQLKTADGPRVFSVPKKTLERNLNSGVFDWTAAHYLQNALAGRRFEDLAASKDFIFFPKHPDSPAKAQAAVRELLNSARERCMILDPYFSRADMLYIYHIENISLTVQVISSADFLNERPRQEAPDSQAHHPALPKTHLEMLQEELERYEKAYPLQKIACKVLRGSPSPLHDRFIVVDDRVYLLGSSLNEFGNRTTTIIKVPAPDELIRQAESWWQDEEHCPAIADYVKERSSSHA